MAIRQIRIEGDPILRKRSKEVRKITPSTLTLLDDMKETMEQEEGVGLAAPQVGSLRRIFIVDVGEGVTEFINPEIIETSGNQTGPEGCLSVPGESGIVSRANYVKIKAQDRNGDEFIIEAQELMARAILHEYDHLEGTLFIDKMEEINDEEMEAYMKELEDTEIAHGEDL